MHSLWTIIPNYNLDARSLLFDEGSGGCFEYHVTELHYLFN